MSAVVSLAAGETRLGPVFLLGVLASLVGLAVLSVEAIRTRGRGWWAATALADTSVAARSADAHAV